MTTTKWRKRKPNNREGENERKEERGNEIR
jgi:hypothetical protein